MIFPGRIAWILCAAVLLAHRPYPAFAFSVPHQQRQSLALRPVTSFGLSQKIRSKNQPALGLFPRRRSVFERDSDKHRRSAPPSRSRFTWKTTVAAVAVILRQTRRIVASLALALCIWLHGHGLVPSTSVMAHAKAPAPPAQEQVKAPPAKKNPTKAIVLCGGVVLANELYKRSLHGSGDSSLSAPNENDNVDNVFTRPIQPLEEITPTALSSNTTTNATDVPSNNMTAVQKIQQQVEQVASKVEGKIQEWTTAAQSNTTSSATDARKATISLKRTSAGTGQLNTTSTNVVTESSPNAATPRVIVPPPIKIPTPAPAVKIAPPPAAVTKTQVAPTISPAVSAAAVVSDIPTTPANAPAVSPPVVGVQPLIATSVPELVKPAPVLAPAEATSSPSSVPVQGKTAAPSPLSPMGLGGGSDKAAAAPKDAPKTPVTKTAEPEEMAPTNSGPKHEALRLIGFGNTTFGTPPATVRSSAPKASPAVAAPSAPAAAVQLAKTQDSMSSSTRSSMTASPLGSASAPASVSDTAPREKREVVAVRPPEEEDALQQKYAAIDDLGERAYQILIDLGMI